MGRYTYGNNNPYLYRDPNGRSPLEIIFLVADTASLVSAVRSGEGIGAAAAFVAIDIAGVASPIPGISEVAHAAHALEAGAHASGEGTHAAEEGVAATKRGPRTDPSAPHNQTIRNEADKIESQGGTILAGWGREPESLIATPGGAKAGRRPDILYKDSEGTRAPRMLVGQMLLVNQ